jgi:hypothetical protein
VSRVLFVVLLLIVVTLASALWVAVGGSNPASSFTILGQVRADEDPAGPYPDTSARLAGLPAPGYGAPKPFEGTKVLAQVGGEVIIEADVVPMVEELLNRNKDRIPPEQIPPTRQQLIRQRVMNLVEVKLIFNDAVRKIPKENFPNFEQQVRSAFERGQLPKLLEGYQVQTLPELDDRLRAVGSSLENERKQFVEQSVASQWLRAQVKVDEEIPHRDQLAYYEEHHEEYDRPLMAKWEELSVYRSRTPDAAEARRRLGMMGNRVIDGASWAEVARGGSDSPSAEDGGAHDWTNPDSLASEPMARALQELPVAAMSPILEDERGFHIVRVVERKPAGRIPFSEVQVAIRDKLKTERQNKRIKDYMDQLRRTTEVWTAFDDEEAP